MANRRKRPAETPQKPQTSTVADDGIPSPVQGPTRTGLTTIAAAAILIVAILATYGRSAGSDFVYCDDNIHVFQNPYLTQWSTANLSYLWTHAYEKLYIPVSYTVFAMLAQAGRMQHLDSTVTDLQTLLNPHPFHIANIVLHMLNTLFVFAILRRLTSGANGPSLVGALLFALHPVQVESVAWVSELRGLLCSFFCLAAMCLYLRVVSVPTERNSVPLRSTYYWLSVALTVVALLSKPSAAALPLALFVLDRWFVGRPSRVCAMSVLPYILIVVPIIAITNGVQHLPAGATPPVWARPFIAGDTLAFYLSKLFAPWALTMDYGRRPLLVLQRGWCYATWIAPVAVAAAALLLRRRYPSLVLGCLLSLAFVLPVLGLVPFIYQMHSTVADRYLYLAMMGPSLIVATLLQQLGRQTGPETSSRTTAAYTACGMLLAACAVLSFIQVGCWNNSLSIYEHCVSVSAIDPEMLSNYGSVLHDHGDLSDAIAEYRAAIVVDRNYMLAHTNLGMALMEEGDIPDALSELKTVVQVDPTNPDAHRNLAGAILKTGDNAAALPEIAEAVSLDPTNPLDHANYAYVLMTVGRLADALNEDEKALSLDPSMLRAYYGLGTVQTKLGRYSDAAATFQKALQLAPGDPTAEASLADIQKKLQAHP